MGHHHHDVLQDLREPTRSLRKAIPDAWSGFVALHTGAISDVTVTSTVELDPARVSGAIDEAGYDMVAP